MKELFLLIKQRLLEKEDLVLASIIASRGSTPQGPGAKMLAGKGGRLFGTIGGAKAEFLALEESKKLMAEKRSSKRDYILRPDESADIGAKCGGEFSVYLKFLDSEDSRLLSFVDTALLSCSLEEPSWLVTRIGEEPSEGPRAPRPGAEERGPSPAAPGARLLVWPGDEQGGLPEEVPMEEEPVLFRRGPSLWFSEPLVSFGIVYVFGGGHVAQALVPLLTGLGFRCVVFDDRPEFTGPELFPSAKTITADFSLIDGYVSLSEKDYVVVVTRGHVFDVQAEAFAIRSRARYIGVIGSRAKQSFVREQLAGLGFSADEINAPRVHAPIGIPIGSKTPAEIAVSIAAEMIRERSGAAATNTP
jgi:xanthine dehydrogenase accessory factor